MKTRVVSPSKAFQFQRVIGIATIGFAVVPAHPAAAAIGALEQQLIEIYRQGDHLDPCETTDAQKTTRLNLVRALDKRELELDDLIRAGSRGKRPAFAKDLSIGPLTLTPRSEIAKATGKKIAGGWIASTAGWDDYGREFANLGGSRVNARWVRLLSLVRATLADDYRRAVRGAWFGASVEGVAEAPKLAGAIVACLKEKKCEGLAKPDAFRNALGLARRSAGDYADYAKATSDSARERALKNLLAATRPFLAYFEPTKLPGVRFVDEKTLAVNLDAGDFRGYESALEAFVEGFWRIGGNALRIDWTTASRSDPTFKFAYLSSPKDGSAVDFGRRTIALAQGAPESMPAHLVGRALGFRARFFPVWRPELCKYEDQSRPDDLLSDGRTGSISTAHWNSLKATYAEKKRGRPSSD